jgi:hypothetical protein
MSGKIFVNLYIGINITHLYICLPAFWWQDNPELLFFRTCLPAFWWTQMKSSNAIEILTTLLLKQQPSTICPYIGINITHLSIYMHICWRREQVSPQYEIQNQYGTTNTQCCQFWNGFHESVIINIRIERIRVKRKHKMIHEICSFVPYWCPKSTVWSFVKFTLKTKYYLILTRAHPGGKGGNLPT